MILPDFKLIGSPGRFRNGHGRRASTYAQKYRYLNEKRIRSVSLQTTDLTTARRRAVEYVEDRIRADLLARDPQARTLAVGIAAALKEYLDHLTATGNSAKQVATVKMRIERVIKQAKLKEYSHIESIIVTKAIAKLSEQHGFGVVTCNRYRRSNEGMEHDGCNATTAGQRIRCKTWPSSRVTTRTLDRGRFSRDQEFERLLATTMVSKDRRNLSGEQRYWLYLIATQTGLRAQELNSLKPTSFDLNSEPATVTIACTVSQTQKDRHAFCSAATSHGC